MAYRQAFPLFALTGGSALISLGTCLIKPCLDGPNTGFLYSAPPATEPSTVVEFSLSTPLAQIIHQVPTFSNYVRSSKDPLSTPLPTTPIHRVAIDDLRCLPSEAPLPNYFLPERCTILPPASVIISVSSPSSPSLAVTFCLCLLCAWAILSFRSRIAALCSEIMLALAFRGYLMFTLGDDVIDDWTGTKGPRVVSNHSKASVRGSSSLLLSSSMVPDSDVNGHRPSSLVHHLAGPFSASSEDVPGIVSRNAVAEDFDATPKGRFSVIHPPRYATQRATDGDCRYQAYKRVYIGAERDVGQDRRDGLIDGSAHVPYRTTTFGPHEKDDGPSLNESRIARVSRPPLMLLANKLPAGLGAEETDPSLNISSVMPSRRSSLSVSFSDELKYRILSPLVENDGDRFASNSLSSPFLVSIAAQEEKLPPLPRQRSTDLRTGQKFRDARRSTAALDASRSAAFRYARYSTTAPDTGRLTSVRDGDRSMSHRRSLDTDDWERSSTSSRASKLSSRISSQSLSRSFGRLSLDSEGWERSSVSSRTSASSASSMLLQSSGSSAVSRQSRPRRVSSTSTGGSPRSSAGGSPRSYSSSRYSSSSRTSSRASSPSASDTESLRSLNDESLLPYANESLLSDHDDDLPFASPSTPTPARSRGSTKRWQRPEVGWPREDPKDEDMEPMTADGQFNMAWWHKRKEVENRPSTPSVISVVG
ncbi:uncharacterized protein SCHCODRAFT_02735158 [Schizophyllum commune H4-8]|uniref:uncharacterized protein n=1 Tax=Schizophyllum commune (strain H4-8 / FGSC 9210) TaxID=578458 RepID=UPI00215E4809|nr:uncharacterized protein SCHCODRAFT_02735158 [Schizophyllum commune H4-8]KAI5891287.1 hypothetical protein SCHCODRAFT_02735158 [Schizophyllum commune H4-8]